MGTFPDSTNLREIFFDKAHEAFAIFDKEFRLVDVNEAFLRTLHLKREQIVGKQLGEISPGIEKTERYQQYREILRTGTPLVLDESRTHPSVGNYVSRLFVFKLGEGLGMAILNITDLAEAVDELERFIYKVSHDVRGPIARIRGIANLASRETNLEVRQTYVKMVQDQTDLLEVILKRLLDASRIREGKKIIYQIDFADLIGRVKRSLESMEGFYQIRIEQELSHIKIFYSDKNLITSIFENLIDNAVKYRKPDFADAFVKISISDQDDGVTIVVADNGIGIESHLQLEVFKLFFRGTDSTPGAGLGLYTVNRAVKKLDGRIFLESEPLVGTTVTVVLPNEKVENPPN